MSDDVNGLRKLRQAADGGDVLRTEERLQELMYEIQDQERKLADRKRFLEDAIQEAFDKDWQETKNSHAGLLEIKGRPATPSVTEQWLAACERGDVSTQAGQALLKDYSDLLKQSLEEIIEDVISGKMVVRVGISAKSESDLRRRSELIVEYMQSIKAWWYAREAEQPSGATQKKYPMHTSLEFDAIEKAASDGKSGDNYISDEQSLTRIHRRFDSSRGQFATHYVEMRLTEQERRDGVGMDALIALSKDQDADCIFTLLYVSCLLTQNMPAVLPAGNYVGGWIDIDDVIRKIGWTPRNAKDREDLRRRVYRHLQFGARAVVKGDRTSVYTDQTTKERISTRIDAPLWAFMASEQDVDKTPSLYPIFAGIPRRQELVLSKEWMRLLTQTGLVQMLPMGEKLGSIPADQPSGAWARVIGLALANLWRREPGRILGGTLPVTRRELLTRFTPKHAPLDEILRSKDAGRARKYWHLAIDILVEKGFLAKEGEVALRYVPQTRGRQAEGWQKDWLDKPEVILYPGEEMREVLSAIAANKFVRKPRDLSQTGKRTTRKKPSS